MAVQINEVLLNIFKVSLVNGYVYTHVTLLRPTHTAVVGVKMQLDRYHHLYKVLLSVKIKVLFKCFMYLSIINS